MKDNPQFKLMRHIETVRNYLQACIGELGKRGIEHDQSKLQEPELSVFHKHTPKLRKLVYGSDEYKKGIKEMYPAIEHHHANNRHHPEYFQNGMEGMNLFDLLEMLCDWKAACFRHDDSDVFRSITINQKRFKYSDDIAKLLWNTMNYMEDNFNITHHGDES